MSSSDSDSALAPPAFDLSASSSGSASASPEPVKKTKKAVATASDSDDESSSQRKSVKETAVKTAKKAKKAAKKKVEKKQSSARAKTKRARRSGGGRLPAKLQVAQQLNNDAFEEAVSLLENPEDFKKHLDILAKIEAAIIIGMCYKTENRTYRTQVGNGAFEPFGPFLSRRVVVDELVKRINTHLVKRKPVCDKETGLPRKNDDGSPVTRPVVNYFSKVLSFENGILELEVS